MAADEIGGALWRKYFLAELDYVLIMLEVTLKNCRIEEC